MIAATDSACSSDSSGSSCLIGFSGVRAATLILNSTQDRSSREIARIVLAFSVVFFSRFICAATTCSEFIWMSIARRIASWPFVDVLGNRSGGRCALCRTNVAGDTPNDREIHPYVRRKP